MTTLYLDTETFSEAPISHGLSAYVEHPSTELMIATWAVDDGAVYDHDFTYAERSTRFEDAVEAADEIVAHNAPFDREMLDAHGFRGIAKKRWRCTMAQAYAHALPGSLDTLCAVLGVSVDDAKLAEGRALIHLFCKPRPLSSKLRRATGDTHPAEWEQFITYARQDITAMREVDKRLPRWNYPNMEYDLWTLDQVINARGFYVDVEMAEAAVRAAERAKVSHDAATRQMTEGELGSTRQRDEMLEYVLRSYGVALPNLQADTLERRINDPDIPDGLRELLSTRLMASKTSTSKYAALLRGVSADGRLRNTMQFCGAGRTGRWAGRVFQPHNLPRPTMKVGERDIQAITAGCEDLIYEDTTALISSAVRGCIVAPKGRKLVIADLSNIEGRKAAWLAGESWKTNAFKMFDQGKGPDLYRLAYSRPFQIPPDKVTGDQRQIGKVMELFLQYEGGVGAFLVGAATYGIDLNAMAETAWSTIPDDVVREAIGFADWLCRNAKTEEAATKALLGLPRKVFIVCDSLKRMWRREHPNIVNYWSALREAACAAILHPGVDYPVGRLRFRKDGNWLRLRLPSGRCLCYPGAALDGEKITYKGVSPYTKQWSRLHTYGGKIFENVCQAAARDILACGMQKAEAAEYQVVLHVHDELVTETPDSAEFTVDALAQMMSAAPSWADGLPLAAAGFETHRYRKG